MNSRIDIYTANGDLVRTIKLAPESHRAFAWAPDDRLAVVLYNFQFNSTRLYFYYPDGKRVYFPVLLPQLISVGWSFDGDKFLYTAYDINPPDHSNSVSEVIDEQNGERFFLFRHIPGIWGAAWASDSPHIAATDRNTQIWDVTSRQVIGEIAGYLFIQWSRRGFGIRWNDGTVWNVNGELVRTFEPGLSAWHPDGCSLSVSVDSGSVHIWGPKSEP